MSSASSASLVSPSQRERPLKEEQKLFENAWRNKTRNFDNKDNQKKSLVVPGHQHQHSQHDQHGTQKSFSELPEVLGVPGVDIGSPGVALSELDSEDMSSDASDSPRNKKLVGKAVQKFFWAEMKHRLVKKTRHLALATRTLVQAHGSPKAGSLSNKFDKRVAGKLVTFEKQLSQQTQNTSLLKEAAKRELLNISAPLRAELMQKLREIMKKNMTSDPDMWERVKVLQRSMIDSLWEDVEKEIELNVELAWLQPLDPNQQPEQGSKWSCCESCYRFVRRKVLRHYLPFDRSIFGKLKDPIYVALTLTMLIPNAGFRVSVLSIILTFILFPRPPDEFQIINFILLCKGTQFLTGGLVSMGQGATIYFGCFNWHETDMTACIAQRGPGNVSSLIGELADYWGSIVLVWIAFLNLPFAQEHRQQKRLKLQSQKIEKISQVSESESKSQRLKIDRGGRMSSLLNYDVACFAFSLLVLLVLTGGHLMMSKEDHQVTAYRHFQEDIFWCKVLYSLLSMPFALFTIQPLQQVLTHAAPTGFNDFGECVPFRMAEKAIGSVGPVGSVGSVSMAEP